MDNLKEWIEEVLNDNGCHLYELEWITNQGTPLLRVSVEKKTVQWIWILVQLAQMRLAQCLMKRLVCQRIHA